MALARCSSMQDLGLTLRDVAHTLASIRIEYEASVDGLRLNGHDDSTCLARKRKRESSVKASTGVDTLVAQSREEDASTHQQTHGKTHAAYECYSQQASRP